MLRAPAGPVGNKATRRWLLACRVAVVPALLLLVAPVPLQAEDNICGEPKAEPAALYERLAKDSRLREMHRSDEYVALENGLDGTLWTFTLPKHPAHPAVVCRTVIERRGIIDIPTSVVCDGPAPACAELKADFEALNARMIEDLYKLRKSPAK